MIATKTTQTKKTRLLSGSRLALPGVSGFHVAKRVPEMRTKGGVWKGAEEGQVLKIGETPAHGEAAGNCVFTWQV